MERTVTSYTPLGTETVVNGTHPYSIWVATYTPHGDGYLVVSSLLSGVLSCYILSPSGDGYRTRTLKYGLLLLHLIPLWGRKLWFYIFQIKIITVTSYPPSGDGNKLSTPIKFVIHSVTSYPPLGTETGTPICVLLFLWLHLIPPPGTETIPGMFVSRSSNVTFYTPSGDGNPLII